MKDLQFRDIRQDWYYSNQLLPRLVRKSMRQSDSIRFVGFPRQWIPIFEYYGIRWARCSKPPEYMPIISEISDNDLARISTAARSTGTLRSLVESISVLDPLLADFLYIVDHSLAGTDLPTSHRTHSGKKLIRLCSWQSYGRPEILQFDSAVDEIKASTRTAVLLPCSRKRPYQNSRTHRKIWQSLRQLGYDPENVDQIVITSLGVVPQPLWEHPVVMSYDAGVPDIYRILRLARRFFGRNSYERIVDCLQFMPYSDIFKILQREKLVKRLLAGPVSRSRQFYVKA